MRFWNCEFIEKWDFENVNFVKKWDFEIENFLAHRSGSGFAIYSFIQYFLSHLFTTDSAETSFFAIKCKANLYPRHCKLFNSKSLPSICMDYWVIYFNLASTTLMVQSKKYETKQTDNFPSVGILSYPNVHRNKIVSECVSSKLLLVRKLWYLSARARRGTSCAGPSGGSRSPPGPTRGWRCSRWGVRRGTSPLLQ